MSVHLLPLAVLAAKDQCDPKRDGGWCVATYRGGRVLKPGDLAQVAADVGGGEV
jgi:hypothetical protein